MMQCCTDSCKNVVVCCTILRSAPDESNQPSLVMRHRSWISAVMTKVSKDVPLRAKYVKM